MSKTFLSLCSKTWSRSDSPVSSFHAESRRQSGDRVRSRRSEKNASALGRAGRSELACRESLPRTTSAPVLLKSYFFLPTCVPYPSPASRCDWLQQAERLTAHHDFHF